MSGAATGKSRDDREGDMDQKDNTKILSVKDLSVSYQKLRVVFDVSIEVDAREVVVVVGRNGA